MLPKLVDSRDASSLASRMRFKRNEWFRSKIDHLARPLTILDIGGLPAVWETINFVNRPDIQITLLNVPEVVASIEHLVSPFSNMTSVGGDARDMRQFRDQQFDVVYSNSVIEHVGNMDDMRRMASEMRRVGKRYFLQTPNRYFPIEPHFVFPMFQFLPFALQVYLVQHFDLGWMLKSVERTEAEEKVRSIQLLSRKEVRMLFPDAELGEEKFAGLVKSLLAYKM
jgi:ubiquinone/menaquinone biosynthesis C-methylase UbiE